MDNQQLPPEILILKEKISDFKNKFTKFTGFTVIFIILAILFLSMIFSLFFSIEPDQDGVVLRFGQHVRTVGPGLHFKAPWGVETVEKVRTRAILKEEFGFSTIRAGIRSEYDKRNQSNYDDESIMLTGDLNVADVEWIVQYKIKDAFAYLFNVRNVGVNIRALSESVMRQVVGDRTVSEVLTYGRLSIQEEARDLLQEILDTYHIGISVVTINLQDVNPPELVKPSFNEVNAAKQESDQLINEAWKQYNQVMPEATGKASKTIANAEGYAIERINNAKGDAERFMNLQKEYSKAVDVTKKRLYLETMQRVIENVNQVYVVDPELKSIVPLLNLEKGQAVSGKSN